jgi:hypothetical protein
VAETILSPRDVRELAIQGRVRPDPRYHAREHHLAFGEVVLALKRCQWVRPDSRLDANGQRRHPNGFISMCWRNENPLRVDFNLEEDEGGSVLLVVTAMER